MQEELRISEFALPHIPTPRTLAGVKRHTVGPERESSTKLARVRGWKEKFYLRDFRV